MFVPKGYQRWLISMQWLRTSTVRTVPVDLMHDSRANLVGEFKQWLWITSILHEGPWQQARYFVVALGNVLSDAYSVAWGAVVNTTSGTFPAGRVFSPACLSNHINHK